MRDLFVDYMRLMRLPGIVGLAITPVIGALSVNNTSLLALIPLFAIGVISKIYGFVMNDYVDVDLDKLSKDLSQRALVKGTIPKKNALILIITCFFLGYIAIFAFFYRPHSLFFMGLLCVIIADILGIVYNLYGKKLIGSDFLIALSESLFLLFGALVVLNNEPPGLITWIIFILLFNEQLYMNAIAGGLKDADHDYLLNVKNIALSCGVKVSKDKKVIIPMSFKAFGLGERFFSVFLVFVPFLFYGIDFEIWQISLLIFFAFLLLSASVRMLTIRQFERKEVTKLISAQLVAWYFLVNIMLVSFIGPIIAFILIVLPMVGYVLFSVIMGQKLFEPQI